MATIGVLGTLDSKGVEHAFLADQIRSAGHEPLLIDVGTLDAPTITPDITREEVAAAGGIDLPALTARRDRGASIQAMSEAAPILLSKLVAKGRIDGVIALGGGGGTSIATAAMRALPIGLPKVMVSTLAGGDASAYVGQKDIVMVPSIVDIAGLNRISRRIFAQAARAVCGMVEIGSLRGEGEDRPVIAASQFGNTTDCVEAARRQLTAAGYEVLVFHATGVGGRTMESLVESGMVTGVLDITTTEWADELVGGVLGAGETRLEAAARHGVPAVVAPGCLDMVNFQGPDTVPPVFAGRRFYQHNPQVTLMRTTVDESRALGIRIAEKLNLSTAAVTFMIPRRAMSVIGAKGQPFHDPEADAALFDAVRETLHKHIPVVELDVVINDPAFATACVEALLGNLAAAGKA